MLGVRVCVRRIRLGGEGNAMCTVLSSLTCNHSTTAWVNCYLYILKNDVRKTEEAVVLSELCQRRLSRCSGYLS